MAQYDRLMGKNTNLETQLEHLKKELEKARKAPNNLKEMEKLRLAAANAYSDLQAKEAAYTILQNE